MNEHRYFVIFGAMRTGSNLLEKTLGTFQNIVCYGEAFNPAFVGGPRKRDLAGWTRSDRDAAPLAFLEALVSNMPGRVAGMRMFDGHSEIAMRRALSDPRCARIVLRRDPVESFVSLEIARATDQWMVKDPRRRVTARVTFDAQAYRTYLTALERYYAWIDAEMAKAGTEAFRVHYDQLADRAMLQAVAHHVGAAGRVPERAPILRQNPEPLSRKVVNFSEMCAAIGRVPAGEDAAPVPGTEEVLLAPSAPLALAPIEGPGLAPGLGALLWVDAHDFGGPGVRPRHVLRHATQGGVRRAAPGQEVVAERMSFAVICHPVARLRWAMLEDLFGSGWFHSPVRRAIIREVGGLPSPKVLADDPAQFGADRMDEVFPHYVALVAEALAGKGGFGPRPIWMAQTALIEGYRARMRLDHLVPLDDLVPWTGTLGAERGFTPMTEVFASRIRRTHCAAPVEIDRPIDPVLEGKVRALYARDYDAFGIPVGEDAAPDDHASWRGAAPEGAS